MATKAEASAAYGEDDVSEIEVFQQWLDLKTSETRLKKQLKDSGAALDAKALAKYPDLSEGEVKTLVVKDKWLAVVDTYILGEVDQASQELTQRVGELAGRYEKPLPILSSQMSELEDKVAGHLEKMGFEWA